MKSLSLQKLALAKINSFNPNPNGKGAKSPPPSYQFFLCNYTNVGFSLQNFLTFSFNPFATLAYNFLPSASPKLLNLNQNDPSKKRFFWSNPYKIEIVITFIKEMLELSNFDHMTTSTISFESRGIILLVA